MAKISVEFPIDIDKLVDRLTVKDRVRLMRKLEKETLGKRIDNLLGRIDQRRKKIPISEKEITEIVKEVRKELYG